MPWREIGAEAGCTTLISSVIPQAGGCHSLLRPRSRNSTHFLLPFDHTKNDKKIIDIDLLTQSNIFDLSCDYIVYGSGTLLFHVLILSSFHSRWYGSHRTRMGRLISVIWNRNYRYVPQRTHPHSHSPHTHTHTLTSHAHSPHTTHTHTLHTHQCYSCSGRQLIGALNAASNITGVLTSTDSFSAVLHKYGALAFWDYATAGKPHEVLVVVRRLALASFPVNTILTWSVARLALASFPVNTILTWSVARLALASFPVNTILTWSVARLALASFPVNTILTWNMARLALLLCHALLLRLHTCNFGSTTYPHLGLPFISL